MDTLLKQHSVFISLKKILCLKDLVLKKTQRSRFETVRSLNRAGDIYYVLSSWNEEKLTLAFIDSSEIKELRVELIKLLRREENLEHIALANPCRDTRNAALKRIKGSSRISSILIKENDPAIIMDNISRLAKEDSNKILIEKSHIPEIHEYIKKTAERSLLLGIISSGCSLEIKKTAYSLLDFKSLTEDEKLRLLRANPDREIIRKIIPHLMPQTILELKKSACTVLRDEISIYSILSG